MLALVAAAALVSLAVISAQPDQPGTTAAATQRDGVTPAAARTLVHAEAACDLTSKAERAAEDSGAGERARFAASVLLLDHAIIESGRAAESDSRMVDLDVALRAVHTAGHKGDDDEWRDTLDTAKAECRTVLDVG